MNSDVIREYLVAIKYSVDGSSQERFVKSLAAAGVQAKLLADAIEAAARAVHDAVAAMARDLEQMYFASQRTKASVDNIKALGFALSQVGGSAEGALGAIESIARFMRNNPGGEGFIRGLGVQTRGANGALRDTSEIVGDLGKRLAAMPAYMANAYAGVLGFDERTLLAFRQSLGDYAETYRRFVAAAHLDQQKAATDSHAFMVASRTATAATSVLFEKVAAHLAGPLAAQFDRFTAYLVAHYDQIGRGLEAAGKVVLWFMGTVVTGVMRAADAIGSLMQWFDSLDGRTQRLIEMAGALLIAWRLLSEGFLATPLGLVIAGLTALFLLLEDYSGWKNGKRSLIDWSLFDGGIQKALAGFKEVGGWINDLVTATVGWEHALEAIAVLMAGSWVRRVVGAFTAARAAQAAAAAETAAGAAGGAARAAGGAGLMRFLGPVGAFLYGMSPTTTGGHESEELAQRRASGQLGSSAPTAGARTDQSHAMAVLMGLGWSKEQAAGLAANINVESGGRADADGDNHQAYGIAQWHPDRQANFAKWVGHDIHGSSVDEQLRFMDYELRQGTERAAGRALMMAQSARDAGAIVSSRYERPRDQYGNMLARGSLAEQYAAAPLMRAPGLAMATAGTTTNAPVLNSTTTIYVDGSRDPQATAQAIGQHQDRVADAAARKLRNVTS